MSALTEETAQTLAILLGKVLRNLELEVPQSFGIKDVKARLPGHSERAIKRLAVSVGYVPEKGIGFSLTREQFLALLDLIRGVPPAVADRQRIRDALS